MSEVRATQSSYLNYDNSFELSTPSNGRLGGSVGFNDPGFLSGDDLEHSQVSKSQPNLNLEFRRQPKYLLTYLMNIELKLQTKQKSLFFKKKRLEARAKEVVGSVSSGEDEFADQPPPSNP